MAISPGEEDAPTLDAWLDGVAGAGLEAVQVRRKASDDVTVLGEVRRARAALGEPVAVLLNGRADLAAVAGADGVHLPAAGVPAAVVRHCLEPHALIGRSTHALEEVEAAAEERVDYVTFGPVFATPSKVRFGSPVGLEALSAACRIGPPVLALGGVTTIERVSDCRDAGAWGIAGIRLFDRGAGLDPGAVRALLDR